MRTIAAVLIVFCIGASVGMVQMSGFADVWGGQTPQTDAAQAELNDSAAEVDPVGTPVQGPVDSGSDSLAGIIVNGFSGIVNFAGAVVALPATLMNLGFPGWFAVPFGRIAQFIGGIGAVQFATGRVWD